jgi:ubiquinone/menaquinone biosynthesis C-methylase UbiE
MPIDNIRLLTDRAYLTGVQYRTDANLSARQSVYAYQQPRIDLVAAVLDLAGLTGTETVADIGCGNGIYLAELARRGHAGRLLGLDLSPGMLAITRVAAPETGLLTGDAAALPLADGVADLTLAPHMLYHVQNRPAAARELRRITRPGGQLLVVLNGPDHLAELGALVNAAAVDAGLPDGVTSDEYRTYLAMTLDKGADLLASVFGTVQVHHFAAELLLPDAEPVAAYVASMRTTQEMPDPARFVESVIRRIPFGPGGLFRVTTHSGLLICR